MMKGITNGEEGLLPLTLYLSASYFMYCCFIMEFYFIVLVIKIYD